jgi:hypothetical protein
VNLVDSSGWLEYFADGPNASFFESPITGKSELIVPTVVIFEVCKRVLQQRGEEEALDAFPPCMEARSSLFLPISPFSRQVSVVNLSYRWLTV